MQALAEATEAYFPSRRQRAAWSRFRTFLADPQADHAGFEVGDIDTGRLRPVSAKLLSRAELECAAAYLGSVRSGLGAASTRSVACRHFELIRATGARRAEAAQLRWADIGSLRLVVTAAFRRRPAQSLRAPSTSMRRYGTHLAFRRSTVSFSVWPAENFGTRRAGTLMASPVRGLWPLRAARFTA